MRVPAIVMAIILLAGCSQAPEPSPDEDNGGPIAGNAGQSGNDAATEPSRNDTVSPPQATLAANVTNGTAPLMVAFSIQATDADGDALAWRLDINGTQVANGTRLPATFNHTFNALGNHTANLTVTDGVHEVTSSVGIDVSEALAGAAGQHIRREEKSYSGTFAAAVGGITLAGVTLQCGSGTAATGIHTWELTAAEADGTATMVANIAIALTSSDTVIDADLFFKDPSGETLASGTTGSADESVTVAGPLGPGTYTIEAVGCIAANGSYSVAAAGDYITA